MRVIFTPLARGDLLDAQDWYQTQHPGLGSRFRQELEASVTRIQENPHQFPVVFQDVPRARLRKFPYGLFFRVETSAALVIACFHGSRDPQGWERRV